MKFVREIAGWLVPMAILGLGVLAFVSLGSQPPPERKRGDGQAAIPVRTVEAAVASNGLEIEADGVVVPLREITLAAEVAGRVQSKSAACNEGQIVAAGTTLFEIDPRDYELDVERLERELKQAGLAIEELDEEIMQNASVTDLAKRQVDLARRETARLDSLKAGKIVTESEHDRALREELAAMNALTAAEGQRRVLAKRRHKLVEGQSLAATMLEKSKLDMSRTKIVTPIDGVVVEDKVEQDSFVAKGTPLVTIEDTRSAEVRTSLQMNDLTRIWGSRRHGQAAPGVHGELGVPATVVFALGDVSYEWRGSLTRPEGRGLDEKTRMLPCRVLVENPRDFVAIDGYGAAMPQLPLGSPKSLLRGMFVRVRVHVDTPGELVSIPEECQRPSGEVWLVRDGRLVIVKARALQVADGRLIFDAAGSGISAGDRVVISQLSSPRPGMEVVEAAEVVAETSRSEAKGAVGDSL